MAFSNEIIEEGIGQDEAMLSLDTEDLDAHASSRPLKHKTCELPEVVKVEHDEEYYLSMIQFEVEDTAFMLPAAYWPFAVEAPGEIQQRQDVEDAMSRRSLLPADLCIEDVQMYFEFIDMCIELGGEITCSRSQCMEHLLFATHCGFHNLVPIITDNLKHFISSDLEWVAIGREFGIPRCLRSVFEGFTTRRQALTVQEVEILGLATSAHIVELRERVHYRALQTRKNGIPLHIQRPPPSPILLKAVVSDLLSNVPSKWGGNILKQIPVAKREGILDWLYDAYQKLVKRPWKLTKEQTDTLQLPPSCVLELSCAHDVYWASSKEDQGGHYDVEWELALTMVKRAVALTWEVASWDVIASPLPFQEDQDLPRKLRVGFEYKLGSQEWLQAACCLLLSRDAPISVEDAQALGIDAFVVLARGRELCWLPLGSPFGHIELFRSLTPEDEARITIVIQEDLLAYVEDMDPEGDLDETMA